MLFYQQPAGIKKVEFDQNNLETEELGKVDLCAALLY